GPKVAEFLPHRDWLVAALADFQTGSDAAVAKHNANLRQLSRDVFEFVRRDIVDDELVKRHMIFARTARAAIAHVAALILDPQLDYGRRLRRCPLVVDGTPCGKFFLLDRALPRGRPSDYCSEQHRTVGRKLAAQDRVSLARKHAKERRN